MYENRQIYKMPKNKNGGNKAKKQANNKTRSNAPTPLPSPDQRILIIRKVFGNCFFEGSILNSSGIDESRYQLKLHKGARRYGWVGMDSLVLASQRDFNDKQYDILYLYNGNDVHFLKRNHIIPSSISNDSAEDDILVFTNEEQEVKTTRIKNNDDDYNNVIPDDYFHPRRYEEEHSTSYHPNHNPNHIFEEQDVKEETKSKFDDIDFDTL